MEPWLRSLPFEDELQANHNVLHWHYLCAICQHHTVKKKIIIEIPACALFGCTLTVTILRE